MRPALALILVSLLASAYVPTAEAQRLPATLTMMITNLEQPVEPGSTVKLEVHTLVSFSQGSYCFDEMRLLFSIAQAPAHASLVVEPAKIAFRLADEWSLPVASTSMEQARFTTAVILTPGLQAPAYVDEPYVVHAQLLSPTGPTCSVPSLKAIAYFTVKNAYRPDTHVAPQGWSERDPSIFEVLATNHGNGFTRIRLEEVLVDPISIGKLHAEDLSLDVGQSGVFSIAVRDRSVGNYTAVVGLRSSYDGSVEGPTDLDEVTIHVGDAALASESFASGTAPNLGALASLVSLVGMLVLRRRSGGE